MDFYNAAKHYSNMENLNDHEKELLFIAALFHDTGYLKEYKDNEPLGADIAESFMIKHGYPKGDIDTVKRLILATRLPQKPQDKLERIMCDCDLDYLGTEKFKSRSSDLRKEWEEMLGTKYSKREWLELQLRFLANHKYFTNSAQVLRNLGKSENMHMIQSELESTT